MNGWKVLVGVLVVTNFAWLGWGLLESGAGLKQMESSGLRSEWVTIEKPWQQAVEVARSNAPVAPKINLKEGLAQLDSAIESASKQVFEDPKNNQTCLQWGPLLQSESARVADSLSNWGGGDRPVGKAGPCWLRRVSASRNRQHWCGYRSVVR